MEKKYRGWFEVPVEIKLPATSGKYIVRTKSTSDALPNTGNVFECMFFRKEDGTGTWDCSHQVVTHWFLSA